LNRRERHIARKSAEPTLRRGEILALRRRDAMNSPTECPRAC